MKPIEAKDIAEKTLSAQRYHHTECVAAAAKQLAKHFGENEQKAEIAGYLHDIVKEFPKGDLLQMIGRSDIIELDTIIDIPSVWHGYAGGIYVKETFGLDDEIADAVSYHTTARKGMSKLEKIVYIADCISTDRTYEDNEEIWELVFSGEGTEALLDRVSLTLIERQLSRLIANRRPIDINSIKAYNELSRKIKALGEDT